MEPRVYSRSDRDACLAVFDSNALPAREEFEQFLDAGDLSNFTVLEHDGSIVGCGGFVLRGNVAILLNGIIRKDMQRMGLGRFLLMYRLRQISRAPGQFDGVNVEVLPQWAAFYEKQGFKRRQQQDTSGPAQLFMKLTVCP